MVTWLVASLPVREQLENGLCMGLVFGAAVAYIMVKLFVNRGDD